VRTRRLAPLLACALLAAPSAACAEILTFGSDLSQDASIVESHGADTAFWNVAQGNGQAPTAPADGQVLELRVKGGVLAHPNTSPDLARMVHFQVLHPQPDGSVIVELSSGAFYLPQTNDGSRITTFVTSFRPVNLCVHQGDYVDLNTIGGFEFRYDNYRGSPLQVFAPVAGSATNWYEKDNGTNNGAQLFGQPVPDQELLLQMTMGTGRDATDICPGGYAGHEYRGVEIDRDAIVRDRIARLAVFCPGPTRGHCEGTLRLHNGDTEIGRDRYRIEPATTPRLEIRVSNAALDLLNRDCTLNATATADGRDAHGEGGPTVQDVRLAAPGCEGGGSSRPTNGRNSLLGTAGPDMLCGLLGNDTLTGLGGDDTLWGDNCNDDKAGVVAAARDGNDRLLGGPGDDTLYGAGGNDELEGGPGNDKLDGGGGRNAFTGGNGDDTVYARNGKSDSIRCGRGRDIATVDRRDRLTACERRRRR
jgi:hypothetical protein